MRDTIKITYRCVPIN